MARAGAAVRRGGLITVRAGVTLPQPQKPRYSSGKGESVKVKLATKGGGVEVEAIAAFGGLAVTPWLYNEDELEPSEALAAITHVASGLQLVGAILVGAGIRLMAALCERIDTDWHQPAEVVGRNRALRRRCLALRDEIEAEG